MRLKTYWQVWFTSTMLAIEASLENRLAASLFIAGKFIRFFFFLLFLTLLFTRINTVAGYTKDQMIIFFLTFNLFDLFGQLFFRGIYWFRDQVISGQFDFSLIKPSNTLFQVLTKQTDILDLPLLITVVILLITKINWLGFSIWQWLIIITVCISACLFITAIHTIVASIGVITTEVDHTIMIYRDLSQMARFPIDIYNNFIRSLLTFIIPISLAYTLPAKSLLGLASYQVSLGATFASLITFLISLSFWRYALKKYSSASS